MLFCEHPPSHEKLDKLAESLFDTLEKLRATARAMADNEAIIEKRLRLLEAGDS
jgi:hypothetical protein